MKWWRTAILPTVATYMLFKKAHRNTAQLQTKRIHVAGWHASKDSSEPSQCLNILHLSDFHLENISITPEQLYTELAGESIDLIALTGDYLDRKKNIPKLIPYLHMLRRLNPAYGMYAVFGNHDYLLRKPNFALLERTLQEHGCITLRNEHRSVDFHGTKLNIVGIDDFSTGRSRLGRAFEGTEDGLNLVLTHDPNVVLHMKKQTFAYLLSGHFHGGQIHWPKPFHLYKMGRLVRMKMFKGLHRLAEKPFYISEGLGQTGLNIRVGSRPEMTIHHLRLCPETPSDKGLWEAGSTEPTPA